MFGFTLRTSLFTKKWPNRIGKDLHACLLLSEKLSSQINKINSSQIRTITNINPNKSFLKKYFDKNILYINKNVTSTMNSNRIDSVFQAKQFIETLTLDERKIIMEQLTLAEKEASLNLTKLPGFFHYFLFYFNLKNVYFIQAKLSSTVNYNIPTAYVSQLTVRVTVHWVWIC